MKFVLALIVVILSGQGLGAPPPRGTSICGEDCDFSENRTKRKLERVQRIPLEIGPKSGFQKKRRPQRARPASNLPVHYQGLSVGRSQTSEGVVFVSKSKYPKLQGVGVGEMFDALIEQAIKASPSVATPVRAIALSGPLRGSLLFGEAKLDTELKRILFSFTELRNESGKSYHVRAAGLDSLGRVGLEGEYHSETAKFFFAELGAAAAAAIVDSTTKRSQNLIGNWVEEPSLSNAGKKGAVTALSRTAERIAERARSAPEYTEISGYQIIKILLQEDPIEKET